MVDALFDSQFRDEDRALAIAADDGNPEAASAPRWMHENDIVTMQLSQDGTKLSVEIERPTTDSAAPHTPLQWDRPLSGGAARWRPPATPTDSKVSAAHTSHHSNTLHYYWALIANAGEFGLTVTLLD